MHWSIIMKFKSWFCSNSKLIYVKKKNEKMNTLISTFHFLLHNYTAHLFNVLKFSRSFETQWNLLCWKYKINKLSDKVYQLLAHGRWFSLGTPASSFTKTGRNDIAEILLKVAFKHNKSNQIKSFTSLERITIKCSKLRLLLCHFNYVRSMKI